jgi:hypothetical protein
MTIQTQPTDALDAEIGRYVAQGYKLEYRHGNTAVIVFGKRPNHVLHLILSIITFGLWLIVWLIVSLTGGEKRRLLVLEVDGSVSYRKP